MAIGPSSMGKHVRGFPVGQASGMEGERRAEFYHVGGRRKTKFRKSA